VKLKPNHQQDTPPFSPQPEHNNRLYLPFTGRQVQRTTGTASHKEAVKVAAKWEDDLHNDRFKSPSRVTWEEFRYKHETEVLSGLAKNTEIKVSGLLDSVETITNERLSHYVAKQPTGSAPVLPAAYAVADDGVGNEQGGHSQFCSNTARH
jgi:hypothetical protein